jgi:integrase
VASISRHPDGRRMIQFTDADGNRQTIRLGKVNQRQAEVVKGHIEALQAAKLTGHPVADGTSRWVAQLSIELAGKLAKVGLVDAPNRAELEPFLEKYIAGRTDLKPGTRQVYRQVQRSLVEFFGDDKPLRQITAGDAMDWRLKQLGQDLSENTVRKRSSTAKVCFKAAISHRLIDENPFGDLPSTVRPRSNDTRHFVTHEEAAAVLEACPDPQWRLIFALCRYGGLRCPSEVLSLKWEHINWDTERITVPSPKTEHLVDGESRSIPIFPELRPYLEEAFELADPGTEYVITKYQLKTNTNLGPQMKRIVRRAGVEPWSNPFRNLRSTRETELALEHPLHIVCEWIGNTPSVAMSNYLRVTDADYERALTKDSALQNALQQPAAGGRKASQPKMTNPTKPADCKALRESAARCEGAVSGSVVPTGFEPVTSRM